MTLGVVSPPRERDDEVPFRRDSHVVGRRSADLRLGPPAVFGSFSTRLVGKARGPIFVNPFAEPGTEDGLTGRIGRMIRTDMDLVAAPGWPGTWPSQAPSPLGMTIDQVYVTRDLAVRSRRLGEPNGSDHRPVITEIGVAPSADREIF